MKKNKRYDHLLGKSKSEVFLELGRGASNFFIDDLWIYDLKRSCWIRETILFVEFENDLVVNLVIKDFYFGFYMKV